MLKEITSEELINIHPQKIQLIDIREPYELEDGYILGNTNIPMGDILNKKDQLSKTKDIIIYCNTGRRSRPVVYMLKKLHNISAYNLQGGYKNFLKIIAK
jgi:rhodanese-related sulfurtransferase